jgi:RNA polymerase sigma factor (sigma-70 family)
MNRIREMSMSEEQFSVIIEKYQIPVISLIFKMISSWETARDLAQDTFVKLWNYRDKIQTDLPSFTLIYKIAMNISIDFLRKKNPGINEADPENFEDKNTNQKEGEFYQLILSCTGDLKPK